MKTGIEVEAHILQKAEADTEFRARLVADPKGVIEAETGLELPADALVLVEQAIANAQQGVSSVEAPLTQDELVQVMGGFCGNGISEEGDWFQCHPNNH